MWHNVSLNVSFIITQGDYTEYDSKQYLIFVTFFGKTDTNAFPFMQRNRLQSVYIRLNGCYKRLNGLLIRFKKIVSV